MSEAPEHPDVFRPETFAVFKAEKMGKSTLFESERILVGLNNFEAARNTRCTPIRGWTRSIKC